jgi:hypothetical protein
MMNQDTNPTSNRGIETSTSTKTVANPDRGTKQFELIKLTRQHEKASHHVELLSEAKRTDRPPRGLIPKIAPRLPDTSSIFLLDWQRILYDTAIQLTTQQNHPVAIHYHDNNHTEKDYTVIALDREKDKNKRLRLEEEWITLLDTLQPKGLNVRL